MLQAQVPICGWLMAIPWCVTSSGCRDWLLRCSNYFLYGDIGLFRMKKHIHVLGRANPCCWHTLSSVTGDCHVKFMTSLFFAFIWSLGMFCNSLRLRTDGRTDRLMDRCYQICYLCASRSIIIVRWVRWPFPVMLLRVLMKMQISLWHSSSVIDHLYTPRHTVTCRV